MKRKVTKLRLSPNEEARIIREEYERRRKLRIQQVREQQRYIALQIRQEVEQRRQHELQQLEEELRVDWERQQTEKLHTLQTLYQESLLLLGQGHRNAKENEPDLAAMAQREEENHAKAVERYREALKELKSQRVKDHERQNQSIKARKKALQAEKERSAKVASLPLPPPNPIQNIEPKKPHVVKRTDVSAFAATHYHMPESTVDREVDIKQPNAHEEAELEVRRLQDLQREEKRRREEQLEKARLRGRQALRREQLVQDRERLLVELEHMQQTDLLRRRQQVSHMPAQIFQPLYRRQETREDFQREMEFAFEDMYTGERRVKGDLVVQLAPEPLPALSTGSQDQELDVTLDEVTTPAAESIQHDTEQDVGGTEQETSAEVESSRPAPRRALKKLLDRVRSQRNQWTHHGSRVPAADPPHIITDQIPERDTSIETGSLTSEDKDKRTSIELHEPVLSPPALETTKPSAAADTSLPDVLVSRIQEFEEERKKREEELEREKQQQVLLLQELEEQKAKLEQMLLEAKQEREHLKAAVTQEVPVNQPEIPVYDQEVTSVTPGSTTELVPPAGDDDHTRRLREYQQRLQDQNRIHQRSVEVARQRLEEYQRALRIRYNMTATSLPPTVVPPGLVHSPLHSTQSVSHLPAPLRLPTTPEVPANFHEPQSSVGVTTREPDRLASPPRLPGSSLSFGSKFLPDEVESVTSTRNQRSGVTARLADNIMERVTDHLPKRVRPPSVTKEPLPPKLFTPHHSTSLSLQLPSDPIQAISLSITDGAPLVPDLQAGSLSSREGDMERQRREEVQRQVVEQREAVALQQEEERQRRKLQEAQRRVLEQREAVALQQRQQEEDKQRQEEQRQRQEVEMERMRRQKETLQALINDDAPVSETASELLVSADIGQNRLRLLVSLLRAIEESNGGTLLHLEDSPEKDGFPQQLPSSSGQTAPVAQSSVSAGPPVPVSGLSSGLLHPPRAAKPPVTRVRLGFLEMTEQHELSAIQEVDTPVNSSHVTGLEDSVAVPPHTAIWDLQEESESSVASDRTPQTVSSGGQQSAESPASQGTSSGKSSHLIWRERLLMGAGTSPESSDSDSVLRIISPLSSDSGRGADFSGPAVTSNRSPTEFPPRPPESDCLSSTTISTGSYITTDPEQNINADKSPSLKYCVEQESGADRHDVSSPSSIQEASAADSPGLAIDSVFNDSSIQHIIDKYMRELNISLSTAGKTTDSEASYVEESGSSVSQQSLVQVPERRQDENPPGHQSLLSDAAEAQRSGQERDSTVGAILEHFSAADQSLTEDQEQDSFRPLIGQLAEQSSCLAADQRDSTLEQLVGQPSAHSSMIGHLAGPLSLSFDQGGWDSTLSRMIGRLSHQSSSHWLSGGQDFYLGQVMGQMASEESTIWLDEAAEESRMRPLVGEPDESAGQQSGSSGERSHVALVVSTEDSGPSYPTLPTEASSHSASVPHPRDQTQQRQPSPVDLDSERAEDSFHPLLAEVTHNETTDPSMTFHLPEHSVPNSPEGHLASREHSVSTPSQEFESQADPSVDSEPSPEHLRTEELDHCTTASPAFHESFSQLITSQCHPHESVLMVSPTVTTDVEGTAEILSNLTIADDTPAVGMSQPEEGISKKHGDSVPFSDLCTEELKSEQSLDLWNAVSGSEKILEAAGEKGILEQSEITLVSLIDTTLDQDTTITEEGGVQEDKYGPKEDPEGQEIEGSKSLLLPEDAAEDNSQTHPATVLEFHWGPSKGLQDVHQQKRRALLQRSNSRVEEIKAKAVLAKTQTEVQAPPEAREQSKANEAQPVTCKAKTKSQSQHKASAKSKGGHTVHQTTEKSGFIKQKKPQLRPPGSDSRLKKVDEVKICTPEERKRNVSEMHQRTHRLYEQLEEVKHQKAIRSRQEDYAKNRLKAKEFHKKTLQKLRAKQTQQ